MNILKEQGKYFFFNEVNIESKLESKIYLFNFDVKSGNCWLEDFNNFQLPNKIYDINKDLRVLIKESFASYNKNLGVLLTGNKGQGKSVTAKLICNDMNLPTIIINKEIPKNVDFVRFFNDIKQDKLLFLDEFEKLFDTTKNNNEDYHSQESFLSYMDGAINNDFKTLFVLTTNDSVNQFFLNRPSRIKFLLEYDELPEDLFDLITDDKLINKNFKEDLQDNVSMINLNIDVLISIIDDINLFNKPFSEFKHLYNYKIDKYRYEMYIVNNNGNDKYLEIVSFNKKIKSSDIFIHNYKVEEFLKFSQDEIVFKTHGWEEDENGNDVATKLIIKMLRFVNSEKKSLIL